MDKFNKMIEDAMQGMSWDEKSALLKGVQIGLDSANENYKEVFGHAKENDNARNTSKRDSK